MGGAVNRAAGQAAPVLNVYGFIVLYLMNRNLPGFTAFRFGNVDFQDTVFVVGLDRFRINFRWQSKPPFELSKKPFSANKVILLDLMI